MSWTHRQGAQVPRLDAAASGLSRHPAREKKRTSDHESCAGETYVTLRRSLYETVTPSVEANPATICCRHDVSHIFA